MPANSSIERIRGSVHDPFSVRRLAVNMIQTARPLLIKLSGKIEKHPSGPAQVSERFTVDFSSANRV